MRLAPIVLAAALALLLPLQAFSQTADDKAAIQGAISAQLEAFKKDDGAAAYSFAAPNIKAIFPNADVFMGMVKRGYQPVYRPSSYSFGALEQRDGRLVQRVEILGPDGDYWTAEYSLERQADGSWKITGCVLVRNEGGAA